MSTLYDAQQLPLVYFYQQSHDENELTVTQSRSRGFLLDQAFVESLIVDDNEVSTQQKSSDPNQDMHQEFKEEIPEIVSKEILKPNSCSLLKLKEQNQIYFKVCQYLCLEDIRQLQYLNSRFYHQTRKIALRWAIFDLNDSQFWATVCDFKNFNIAEESEYTTLGVNYDEQSQHSRDLDRTFLLEDAQIIEQNKLKLDRVLRALTQNGLYFQGLNYIASAFLINNSQESTYWYTRFILHKAGNFQNNLYSLTNITNRLQSMMRYHHPTLADHLEQQGLTIQYFATRWFIAMFSYDTNVQLMLKLWKLMVLSDQNILVCFALVILKRLETTITQLQEQNINILLKNKLKQTLNVIQNQELLMQTIDLYIKQFGDLTFGFDQTQLVEDTSKNNILLLEY